MPGRARLRNSEPLAPVASSSSHSAPPVRPSEFRILRREHMVGLAPKGSLVRQNEEIVLLDTIVMQPSAPLWLSVEERMVRPSSGKRGYWEMRPRDAKCLVRGAVASLSVPKLSSHSGAMRRESGRAQGLQCFSLSPRAPMVSQQSTLETSPCQIRALRSNCRSSPRGSPEQSPEPPDEEACLMSLKEVPARRARLAELRRRHSRSPHVR